MGSLFMGSADIGVPARPPKPLSCRCCERVLKFASQGCCKAEIASYLLDINVNNINDVKKYRFLAYN
jgi:hypothetical protein